MDTVVLCYTFCLSSHSLYRSASLPPFVTEKWHIKRMLVRSLTEEGNYQQNAKKQQKNDSKESWIQSNFFSLLQSTTSINFCCCFIFLFQLFWSICSCFVFASHSIQKTCISLVNLSSIFRATNYVYLLVCLHHQCAGFVHSFDRLCGLQL